MASKRNPEKALAYMRTSSATNVGEDKDSEARQRTAIRAYAKRQGYRIADNDWFYDAGVKGEDAIEARPGFAALLDRIESNGVRTVIIEDASRFARALVTQELAVIALIKRGVTVITASGENLTETDDPFKVAMRQMAGVFSQLEKARLVAKLKGARERKRAEQGKCEGRKSYVERDAAMVALARQLRGSGPRPALSLREIAEELHRQGYGAVKGGVVIGPFAAMAVARMLKGKPHHDAR
jgi:DNA invertase Pin-like site-specific DNA recombinase